ncbi:MAG TPA: chromosome segregation protein SMC [Myxococcota bacterium]|nr:chromosome segregation protein SMC [Myxococcota bacterium]HRY92572.1 chromosome segregation protein SMC [Myxococcota bacterium]
MKIRRLEIQGFKSFMERTKLRFDDGITGIVGPNGCGKSNVVDAIRWVMGEQSARILRGKNMEDVIFAGSETKPAMGMAEVAITFQNDGRNVPPEYAGHTEITVGRQLFRSGESEYSINRTPCRLLDVQELFMGTGVGTKAYSIIGQGQIGLLVTQKPQDRRALIEEAAGVSKYKARRKVAERKMDQTRQNLLRVQDVVQEIKRSMDSLQRQARKAARYHKLRDQLREIELHTAAHKMLELGACARHLGARQQVLGARDAELAAEVARLEAQVERQRVQLLDDDRALNEVQERLLGTDNQIKLNEKNIEFLHRELDHLSQRGQESTREVEALRAQAEGLGREVQAGEQALRDLDQVAENAATRLLEHQEIHRAQTAKVEQLEAEVDADRQRQMSTSETAAELRSRLAGLEQRLIDLEGRLAQAEAERGALGERLKGLQVSKLDRAEKLSQLKQLHLNLIEKREFDENTLTDLRARAATDEAKAMALKEEIGHKRSRLSSLREIERNYEGCANGVRFVMRHAQERREEQRVVGLVADIVRAPARFETAVQAVLGDRLQSVVVRSQDTGLEAIELLKKESEGRSSFIPVDLRARKDDGGASTLAGPGVLGPMAQLIQFEEDYRRVVQHLVGDVVVVEDLPTAMRIWTGNGHRATLVTLDGEVLTAEGTLTGGSLEGPGIHMLESKREIRELEERLAVLEAELRMVQDRQGKLKADMAVLTASIDSLRQNSHDEELRIVDQQKDLHHLHEQLEGLTRHQEHLGAEADKLSATLAEARAERERTEAALAKLHGEAADLEARVRTGRELVERERRVLASQGQALTELKVQAAAAGERQESARRNQDHLLRTREDFERRMERLRGDISQGNVQTVEGRQRIAESQSEISTLLAQRERHQSELAVRREGYEGLLAEVREAEQRVKERRAEAGAVTSELSAAGLRAREVDMELQHLVARIRQGYKLELADSLSAYHMLPPPSAEAEERAEHFRREIERMGDVNPHAVEEYERLSQRYQFLTTQSQDLNDSLDKLQKVITKINRTSRKRFREAFEAINGKFQEVFPRLFNGGRAELVLQESEDLLESGVDIAAQPPGKKLQNIELLSGGEKALTAVALLFSIFLIKPTPFCLLDEVDAPLDEVNIDRFNAMVKEMSRSSQFILITHNKRTMELLDRLYGVTMEEPGISTVVSVALRETKDGAPPEVVRQAG